MLVNLNKYLKNNGEELKHFVKKMIIQVELWLQDLRGLVLLGKIDSLFSKCKSFKFLHDINDNHTELHKERKVTSTLGL